MLGLASKVISEVTSLPHLMTSLGPWPRCDPMRLMMLGESESSSPEDSSYAPATANTGPGGGSVDAWLAGLPCTFLLWPCSTVFVAAAWPASSAASFSWSTCVCWHTSSWPKWDVSCRTERNCCEKTSSFGSKSYWLEITLITRSDLTKWIYHKTLFLKHIEYWSKAEFYLYFLPFPFVIYLKCL